MKELPDQGFLPVGPRFRARSLAVGQRKQHQCVQVGLILHNVRQLRDRGGIVEISLLSNVRKREVVIDEKDERLALLGRQLQAVRDALGENSARLSVRPGPDGFAGIVQEQGQIKNERILELLEESSIRDQLRILRPGQSIELVDANQRMFVGGVTVEKLVLNQTGQLAEFGNVASEEIDPVHHTKDAAHFAFARQNCLKNLARTGRILKRASN